MQGNNPIRAQVALFFRFLYHTQLDTNTLGWTPLN